MPIEQRALLRQLEPPHRTMELPATLYRFSTILCRANTTIAASPTALPTALGQILVQRALTQQANIRLTIVPHAVRATGKPTNFIPCNSASLEAAPAGWQRTLLPIGTSSIHQIGVKKSDSLLTIHLADFSNSITNLGIGILRNHNTAGTRTA